MQRVRHILGGWRGRGRDSHWMLAPVAMKPTRWSGRRGGREWSTNTTGPPKSVGGAHTANPKEGGR